MDVHEWLMIQPVLSNLADSIRGELDLIAELDAKYGTFSTQQSPSVDPLVFRTFYVADEKLRKLGLTNEADEILERYRDGNAAASLEIVEALLAGLKPKGEGESDSPAGKSNKRRGRGRPKVSEEELKRRREFWDSWKKKPSQWESLEQCATAFKISVLKAKRWIDAERKADDRKTPKAK